MPFSIPPLASLAVLFPSVLLKSAVRLLVVVVRLTIVAIVGLIAAGDGRAADTAQQVAEGSASPEHASSERLRQRFPGAAEPSTAAAEYGEMVRTTPWRSPEDQLAGFHLPPGFEIRLFAAEPQIAKPLNMAFDGRGRLWITQTTAYPYPDDSGSSRGDAIKILEDSDGDGRADRVTTFADGLNIPMGLLPYGDGCLVFSIPNLYYLRDTDGDGICDQRQLVLGPFDTSRDTHGLVNSLRDIGDGWIYACHGFNNRSLVAGTDGHEVRLESGNTFRFRPDGSRVEQLTQGQVNPFGMTRDQWGYWYSADCHSQPISQLIRGACYPSFGRPDDGLGFLPPMMNHMHGSTAISGLLSLPADSSIVPLRGQMISGNVMTSRLNRNAVQYHGATAQAVELPDFLTSDDSWFRPVDIQIDADEQIYVADFYNKIIGHYEVPLEHPERDRTSGRIWQIRYIGPAAEATVESGRESVRGRQAADLIAQMNRLADAPSWSAADRQLAEQLVDHASPHVARAAWEAIGLQPQPAESRVAGDDALAAGDDARLAGDPAMAGEAEAVLLNRLVDRLLAVDPSDSVMRQTLRIALRNRLQRSEAEAPVWDRLLGSQVPLPRRQQVASVLLAVHGDRVVRPLVRYLGEHRDAPQRSELVRHAAMQASVEQIAELVDLAREISGDSLADQAELLGALADSVQRTGSSPPTDASANTSAAPDFPPDALPGSPLGAADGRALLRRWAGDLVEQWLQPLRQALTDGQTLVQWSSDGGDGSGGGAPWPSETRSTGDGRTLTVLSSLPLGESYTGTMRSSDFPMPAEIGFYLMGHRGFPNQPANDSTFVRLVRAADGQPLRQVFPPRSDVGVWVHWPAGDGPADIPPETMVRIEVVDQDAGRSYAWLGVGGFQPVGLDQNQMIDQLQTALNWIVRMQLHRSLPELDRLQADLRLPDTARWQLAVTAAQLRGQADWTAVLQRSLFTARPALLDVLQLYRQASTTADQAAADAALWQALQRLTEQLATKDEAGFVQLWVQAGGSTDRLLDVLEAGWMNPAALLDLPAVDALRAKSSDDQRQRLETLLSHARPLSAELETRRRQLLTAIDGVAADRSLGQSLYRQHCAACHQLRGVGETIGPQLDGVLSRSNERLVEDIVLPDRNVDHAFRTTSFLLDDGRVVVGMVQVDDADQIRLADAAGKILVIDAQAVESRIESSRSLMPGDFIDLLTAEDLAHLLAFMRDGKVD